MSNTIAIKSSVSLTEGYRLPDGQVGSFTFDRGPNAVPADVFGALRAKKNSVTERALEAGLLVEESMRAMKRKAASGDLDLIPTPAIQEETERKISRESKEKDHTTSRRQGG